MTAPHSPAAIDRQTVTIDVTPPPDSRILTFIAIAIQRAIQDTLNDGRRMRDVQVDEVKDAPTPTFRIELPAAYAPRLQDLWDALRAKSYGIVGDVPAEVSA